MITGREQSVQNHVQTIGAVQRENDLLFRRCAKNLSRSESTTINDLLQLLGGVGSSSSNRPTILAVIFVDGVVHTLGLWKARCGIVEVNRWLI